MNTDSESDGAFIEWFESMSEHATPIGFTQNEVNRIAALARSSLPDAGAGTQGDGWQTIETAPRDGTRFLAFDINVDFGSPMCVCFVDVFGGDYCLDVYESHVMAPTHWMPLPAPPSRRRRAMTSAILLIMLTNKILIIALLLRRRRNYSNKNEVEARDDEAR